MFTVVTASPTAQPSTRRLPHPGIRHLRPYRPQTDGKTNRFIRTLPGGWAYGALYRNSTERTRRPYAWLTYYNIVANTQP